MNIFITKSPLTLLQIIDAMCMEAHKGADFLVLVHFALYKTTQR